MSSNLLREIYDAFLDTGELFELMPEATGIWEVDKNIFTEIQEGLDMSIEDPTNPILEAFQDREINTLLYGVDLYDNDDEEDDDPYIEDDTNW